MSSTLNTNIVLNFINKDFIPHLFRSITQRETQNNVQSCMPKLISEKMVIKLLDSNVKNTSRSLDKSNGIQQIQEKPYQKTSIKVPQKKYSHQSKFILKKQKQQSQSPALINYYNSVRPQRQRNQSQLIKLPDQEIKQDKYDLQIRQLMEIKKRMRNFTKDNEQRSLQHAKLSQRQRLIRKVVFRQSENHTYDYETNLIPIVESKLDNIYQDPQTKSLLQIIKSNLDMQIQQHQLSQRIRIKQESTRQKKTQEIKKKRIQYFQNQSLDQQKEKFKKYRPFQFQMSNIKSLTKDIEDRDISSGVKMVTFQQQIVEQLVSTRNKQFSLVSKQVVKQKKKNRLNLDTQGSQSIIYSLQKNSGKDQEVGSKKSSLSRNKSEMEQYYSIQYKDNPQQVLPNKQQRQYEGIKLPQLNIFNRKPKHTQRILTEQKMLKKLSDVQIRLSNKSAIQTYQKNQSDNLSVFNMKKQTQSSVSYQENKSSKVSSKSKKQYVKDYFKNYAQQFRHKNSHDINSLYL